jgi:methyl-accepting chemotaxis protein
MTNKCTNKNRSKKCKTEKLRNGKKILKKIIRNDNSASLNENIKILIGGDDNSTIVRPTKLDMLLGYKDVPIDTTGPFEKLKNTVGDSFEKLKNIIGDSIGSFTALIQGLIARKILSSAGYENKTPQEVANELKNDSKTLEQINHYLQTEDGKEMIKEIKELSKTASDVISESFEEIPDKLDDTMNKLSEEGVKAATNAVAEIPGPNVVISTLRLGENAVNATDEIVKASGQIAELAGDTAEKIKKPIDEIENKIDEISEKASELSVTNVEVPKVEVPIPNTTLEKETQLVNNQSGGSSDINKFIHSIQHGGRKLRKRINTTRHLFKNISKNVTQKKR